MRSAWEASYKGKYVGTIGDIGINSFQLSKSITAGEGGAVVSSNGELAERAIRFHDVSSLRSPYKEDLGGGLLAGFAACNFRMSEFTGAVLKGQLQKLETICGGLRNNARKVREGIADLPGLKLRKSPDQNGDLGVGVFLDLDNRKRRDDFLRAMRAEGVHASGPAGSVILPIDERIENKTHRSRRVAVVQQSTRQSHSVREYECCPRTIDIIGRYGGVIMDPNFTDDDVKDIIAAIRKVYPAMMPTHRRLEHAKESLCRKIASSLDVAFSNKRWLVTATGMTLPAFVSCGKKTQQVVGAGRRADSGAE